MYIYYMYIYCIYYMYIYIVCIYTICLFELLLRRTDKVKIKVSNPKYPRIKIFSQ